jgi:hypothetical protein
MQAYPEKAREYGVAALNRALERPKGATWGTTAVHICFGYAALVAGRPAGYSFLPELTACPVQQVSIETAQSSLDCSILKKLPGKTIILGVLDLSTHEVESAETVAERIRRALPFVEPEKVIVAPDCGLKYLSSEAASAKCRRWWKERVWSERSWDRRGVHTCIAPETGGAQSRFRSRASQASIFAAISGGNGAVLRTVRLVKAFMHSKIADSFPLDSLTRNIR